MKRIVVQSRHVQERSVGNVFFTKESLAEGPSKSLSLRFWGTRGSLPSPGERTVEMGGNTSCVSLEYGRQLMIIDAGSGLRELGLDLMKRMQSFGSKGAILLSHVHWDHVQGFPFFLPAYVPANEFVICGPKSVRYKLNETLRGQMEPPCFPVNLSELGARISIKELQPTTYRLDGITVKADINRHPRSDCFSYRVSHNGFVTTYASDTEHPDEMDVRVLSQAKGADILIYDAQYTPEEYPSKIGWGHSTWLEGVKIAKRAKAGLLVLFHHDPTSSDEKVRKIEEAAQREFPNTVAAREGMTIRVTEE